MTRTEWPTRFAPRPSVARPLSFFLKCCARRRNFAFQLNRRGTAKEDRPVSNTAKRPDCMR